MRVCRIVSPDGLRLAGQRDKDVALLIAMVMVQARVVQVRAVEVRVVAVRTVKVT